MRCGDAVVSSLGSIDFRFDEWRVDVALRGSQKGLMLPLGMALVCVSPRAWERSAGVDVFRIGHLGALNELEVIATLGGTELALSLAGHPVRLGAGVGAAQTWFREQL